MASNNQIIKSRHLPERSFLYYKYPKMGNKSIEFYLPMLENIEISESQRPNLATYDLVGRSGSLYAYLGSKSRDFNLRFNITLPNILDYIINVGMPKQFSDSFRYFYDKNSLSNNERNKSRWLRNPKTLDVSKLDPYARANNYFRSLDEVEPASLLQKLTRVYENVSKTFIESTQGGFVGYDRNDENPSNFFDRLFKSSKQPLSSMKDAVDYLILWLNIIRTSTINNSSDTGLGPPIIYLNHGTMYNNIPCICTNYSVRIGSQSTYDLVSMTPRQIEVSLSLSENRSGDFGKFVPFTQVSNENQGGWESVIDYGTMDPYEAQPQK